MCVWIVCVCVSVSMHVHARSFLTPNTWHIFSVLHFISFKVLIVWFLVPHTDIWGTYCMPTAIPAITFFFVRWIVLYTTIKMTRGELHSNDWKTSVQWYLVLVLYFWADDDDGKNPSHLTFLPRAEWTQLLWSANAACTRSLLFLHAIICNDIDTMRASFTRSTCWPFRWRKPAPAVCRLN